ncbi:MAG TPA: HAMP domain-containing sensor histidine kinase [Acidimicrobiales bacterium]|jgi:signal transduction histidine kinase|nr:HAMP domain-containing sensor histidine kinase [Acidimicrobiales bacterium]
MLAVARGRWVAFLPLAAHRSVLRHPGACNGEVVIEVVVQAPAMRQPVAVRRSSAVGGAKARKRLGMRARVTVVFSLAGFFLSLGLATFTYFLARNELLDQREEFALQQTYVNARLVSEVLRTERSAAGALEIVRTESGGFGLLHVEDTGGEPAWFSQDVRFTDADLPPELRDAVLGGASGRQRFEFADDPYLAVGITIPNQAEYFEVFALDGLNRSLRIVFTSLAIGVGLATLAAAAVGRSVSRRLLRPVSRVADAASELAVGGLDTRLDPDPDPDLQRLVSSFNDMADAVQSRIEREARFASDVSHELRSPITALSAAVEVLAARRAELPPRSQQALDVVVNQVRRFDQMVLDLLELSRIEAGVDDVNNEATMLPETVQRIAARSGLPSLPINVGRRAAQPVMTDKRRLERIVANLLDNAQYHAGGAVRLALEDGPGSSILLAVEDAGPGIPPAERDRVFERFFRGTAARRRVGTGLGLALVAEHAHALGGNAWVEERQPSGSRFVVSIPAVKP